MGSKTVENLVSECDVLVVGGGTAGICAAIQSARTGAHTVIIEQSSQLGGTITNCGVCAPFNFFYKSKQIIAGIGWELISATKKLGNPALKDSPLIDFKVFSLLAEEACLLAGVEIHYHETLLDLQFRDGKWHAESIGSMLKRRILAKEIIDCSGEAVAVRLAGGPCVMEIVNQPGTLEFNFDGFSIDNIDGDMLESEFRKALADKLLHKEDFCYVDQPFINYLKNGGGGNFQHLIGAAGDNAEAQSSSDIEGRQRLLAMLRFLRSVPGLEMVFLRTMNIRTGIREGWKIIGETSVSEADYMSGKIYPDSIAWTYYPIDIHNENGIEMRYPQEGIIPSIPFSSMVPRGMKFILAAGRLISSDRAAFSALRVQAACMATGQAAGLAAALAVSENIPSCELDIADIKLALRRAGAIVPPDL